MSHLLLILTEFLPERTDGTVLTAFNLARAYRQLGHQVSILCRDPVPAVPNLPPTAGPAPWIEDAVDGLRVLRLKLPAEVGYFDSIDNLAAHDACLAAIAVLRPDAIHFHHLEGLSARLPASLGAAYHLPSVLTLHDFHLVCPTVQLITNGGRICPGPDAGRRCASCYPALAKAVPAQGRPLVLTLAQRLWGLAAGRWKRPFLRRFALTCQTLEASSLVAPSRYLAEALTRASGRSHAMSIIGNGSDLVWRERPPANGRPLVIGYMGVVRKAKGLHVLTAALAQMLERPWMLHVHGHGDPRYRNACLQRLPPSRCQVAGAYPPEQAQRILDGIDLLVMPSVWPENCPLVLLQALAAGVPCLVPGWGGMAELVEPGRYGAWYAANDHLDLARVLGSLVSQPESLAAMCQNLRGRPQRPWLDVAREYLALFAKLGLPCA